jgi:CMP-N-acetylneuraminic acid synthetase
MSDGPTSARTDCLAVIPARGGSKRVPGKNVRPLAGKPVLVYTIEAALQSGLFARTVVSTDSARIAAVALEAGAEVPFLRDAALADDHTPVSAVTVDALERLDPGASLFRWVAQLMPNCPLRGADEIRASYQEFFESGAPTQLSITRFGWMNPWWAMARAVGGELQPVFADLTTRRSQDLPELFCPTGAVWWGQAEVLRRHRTYHVPGRTGFELEWRRAVDIDTEEDWAMAEALLSGRGLNGGHCAP